jgi:hypothetical protein
MLVWLKYAVATCGDSLPQVSTVMLPNPSTYGFVPSSKVGLSHLRLVFGANTLFFM